MLLAAPLALAQAPVEVPKFEIRRFVFQGATLVPPAELERATRRFTGKERDFGDVQRALETVERAYSGAGWSAVKVLLPEQALERGEIRIRIVEAKIGRLIVEGNRFFDEANIRASMPALQTGKAPNIHAIARSLRIANENPAKQATVLLRSGQEEATVDAVVRVADEQPRRASVTLDTSGTRETGKLRLGLGYRNSNVLRRDHVLTLQYVGAPHSETHSIALVPGTNVFVFGAGYRIPFYERGDTIELWAGYSTVRSGTVANLFAVTGAGGLAGIRYTQNLDRIGDYEHRVAYSWEYRGYRNEGVRPLGGALQLVRDATVHPVSVLYSGFIRRRDRDTSFSIGFSQNLGGRNEADRARYRIWRWSLNHNRALAGDWQWRFAMNGQLTRDLLISGEQFGIGGADSVRGFLERELTDDGGYRGSVELYTPHFGGSDAIAGARLRALVFADWGGVRRNRPAGGEMHARHIGSYGFGLRLARGNNLSVRLDLATTLNAGTSQGRNESRLHGSVTYVF